jgi:membrane protease YdiL (CAAX protease family)
MATSQPQSPAILIPWGLKEATLGFVGLIALSILVNIALVLLPAGERFLSGEHGREQLVINGISASSILLGTLAFQTGILLITFYLGPRRFRCSISSLGLTMPNLPTVVRWSLLGLALSIGMTAIYNALMINIAPSLVPPTLPPELPVGEHALLTFTVVVLTGPLTEEVFFRGFLFPGFVKKWGVLAGIIVSSALFALSHGALAALIPIFLTGIIFSWIYYRTNSICPTIAAHIMQNTLAYGSVMWI